MGYLINLIMKFKKTFTKIITLIACSACFVYLCHSFNIVQAQTPVAPPLTSIHLKYGNPSNAAAKVEEPDNYLLIKPEYALSYNRSKGIPNWVSWQLNSSWLGDAPRQDNFRPDSSLPTGWYRVSPNDYTNSGFDRGHLTSSEDRGSTVAANSATFLMTNIIPQSPDNNRGPWVQLETYCRNLVKQGKELYIVAGGFGEGGTGEKGFLTVVNAGKAVVPASTWKVILVLDSPGAEVTASTRTIAVMMPNIQGIRTKRWQDYRVSVDDVEKIGYDFFSTVPESIQAVIEAKVDNQ
jgi:endonuclease G, mitochondrial